MSYFLFNGIGSNFIAAVRSGEASPVEGAVSYLNFAGDQYYADGQFREIEDIFGGNFDPTAVTSAGMYINSANANRPTIIGPLRDDLLNAIKNGGSVIFEVTTSASLGGFLLMFGDDPSFGDAVNSVIVNINGAIIDNVDMTLLADISGAGDHIIGLTFQRPTGGGNYQYAWSTDGYSAETYSTNYTSVVDSITDIQLGWDGTGNGNTLFETYIRSITVYPAKTPIALAQSCFVNEYMTGPKIGTVFTRVPQDATSGTGWNWISGDSLLRPDAGATIEGLDVDGPIIGGSGRDNVTIRNCKVKVNGGVYGIQSPSSGWIIEHNEITNGEGTNGSNAIIPEGDNWQVRYNDISKVENGVFISGINTIVERNYVHDQIPWDELADPHVDGIQLFGGNECDGSIIRYNNIEGPVDATSAYMMGSNINVSIHNNRFIGGGWTSYIYYDNSNSYTNNRLTEGGFGYFTDNGGTGTPTITGNIDDITEAPVT